MKRSIAIIIVFVLLVSLAGCSESKKSDDAQGEGATVSSVDNEETEDQDKSGTESEMDYVQMESTVINETLTGMIKALDSIMLVELVEGSGYNPGDPAVYWSTMYYYLCLYGPLANGTSYSEKKEYLIVGTDIVREAGRVLFGETVLTPEIPEGLEVISLHDDGKYYIKNGPRPESYPLFVSAVGNTDGSYEVVAQLVDVHGNILINHSFHLTPKTTVNDLLGLKYYYSVRTAGVG